MSNPFTNSVAINNSTPKQNYSFGKTNRFSTARSPTQVLFYEKKDLFGKGDVTGN